MSSQLEILRNIYSLELSGPNIQENQETMNGNHTSLDTNIYHNPAIILVCTNESNNTILILSCIDSN